MCIKCVIEGKMSARDLADKREKVIKSIDDQAKLGHKFIKEFRKRLEENNFTQFEIGQMLAYELAHVMVDNNFDIFMLIEEIKNKYMNFLEIELNESQKIKYPERFDKDGKRISCDILYNMATCVSEDDALKNMDINDMAKA